MLKSLQSHIFVELGRSSKIKDGVTVLGSRVDLDVNSPSFVAFADLANAHVSLRASLSYSVGTEPVD